MNETKHGDKTIKFTIAFFAKNLDTKNPRAVSETGCVYAVTNKSRGIRPTPNGKIFNSVEEIMTALVKELDEYGIIIRKKDGTYVPAKQYLK